MKSAPLEHEFDGRICATPRMAQTRKIGLPTLREAQFCACVELASPEGTSD